nr:YwaF family protein [Caldicoprobacter algeriensis]
MHISAMLFLFIVVYIAVGHVKQKEYRLRFLWSVWAYAFLVFLNIFRFVWDVYMGIFNIKEDLPLQLCGIQMFAIPLALLLQRNEGQPLDYSDTSSIAETSRWIWKMGEYMCEFVYAYGTVGFVLALILPLPTLSEYPVFHFRSIQSLLYHTAMGFIAFMLPYLNYQPDIRNVKKAYCVLIICAVLTGIVNMLIGSNYLYTAYLPIEFKLLPWPLYLPFLFAFALFVGRLPYYAYAFFHRMCSEDMVDVLHEGRSGF